MEKERLREVIFAAIALAALNEQGDIDHREEQKNPAEAKQEREKAINEFWDKIAIRYSHRPCIECPATDGDDCGYYDGTCGRSIRKKYESIAGIPHPEKNTKEMILPAPVTQVDGVDVSEWTVKQWFQKINEELDELKTEILRTADIDDKTPYMVEYPPCFLKIEGMRYISEEAADTITTITSMLEAMGIDEGMRQEAQRWVNERNAERKRL